MILLREATQEAEMIRCNLISTYQIRHQKLLEFHEFAVKFLQLVADLQRRRKAFAN